MLQVVSCCSLWYCRCIFSAVRFSTKEGVADNFWHPLALYTCHILLFAYSVRVFVFLCICLCGCALVCVCCGCACVYARMCKHACVRGRVPLLCVFECVCVCVCLCMGIAVCLVGVRLCSSICCKACLCSCVCACARVLVCVYLLCAY